MKTPIISSLIFAAAICFAGNPPASQVLKKDGHCLEVWFRTSIETNKVQPSYGWVTNSFTTFVYYPDPKPERPFPRVDESADTFEVVSNTYALFVLDDTTTNLVATSSVKLGTITKTTKTIVTAQTNTVSTETFSSAK